MSVSRPCQNIIKAGMREGEKKGFESVLLDVFVGGLHAGLLL